MAKQPDMIATGPPPVPASAAKPKDPWSPVCPHCGADPAPMRSQGLYELGKMHVVVIYCGNQRCRKIHTIQAIELEEPVIQEPGAPSKKILTMQ